MMAYIEEFCRKGNFIWYYCWARNEFELHHVSIGRLATFHESELSPYAIEGDGTCDTLWRLVSMFLLDYFSEVDGVGQRCMVKNTFKI